MAHDLKPTNILAALRDPRNAGRLNAAAADEIELLRAALDDLWNHGTPMGGGWMAIPDCEWDQIFERTIPGRPKDRANVR